MDTRLSAIETTGLIDENHQLLLDTQLPVAGPRRVRVIVLLSVEDDEISEEAWLYAAARNPAFASLRESAEDIYTLEDGRPFRG